MVKRLLIVFDASRIRGYDDQARLGFGLATCLAHNGRFRWDLQGSFNARNSPVRAYSIESAALVGSLSFTPLYTLPLSHPTVRCMTITISCK